MTSGYIMFWCQDLYRNSGFSGQPSGQITGVLKQTNCNFTLHGSNHQIQIGDKIWQLKSLGAPVAYKTNGYDEVRIVMIIVQLG